MNVGRFQLDEVADEIYIIDQKRVTVYDASTGETLGYFGGNGRLAGQLHFPNVIGIDTRGNIFVGEVDTAKRIQKFAPVMTGGG